MFNYRGRQGYAAETQNDLFCSVPASIYMYIGIILPTASALSPLTIRIDGFAGVGLFLRFQLVDTVALSEDMQILFSFVANATFVAMATPLVAKSKSPFGSSTERRFRIRDLGRGLVFIFILPWMAKIVGNVHDWG
jgi:hypothetical protein